MAGHGKEKVLWKDCFDVPIEGKIDPCQPVTFAIATALRQCDVHLDDVKRWKEEDIAKLLSGYCDKKMVIKVYLVGEKEYPKKCTCHKKDCHKCYPKHHYKKCTCGKKDCHKCHPKHHDKKCTCGKKDCHKCHPKHHDKKCDCGKKDCTKCSPYDFYAYIQDCCCKKKDCKKCNPCEYGEKRECYCGEKDCHYCCKYQPKKQKHPKRKKDCDCGKKDCDSCSSSHGSTSSSHDGYNSDGGHHDGHGHLANYGGHHDGYNSDGGPGGYDSHHDKKKKYTGKRCSCKKKSCHYCSDHKGKYNCGCPEKSGHCKKEKHCRKTCKLSCCRKDKLKQLRHQNYEVGSGPAGCCKTKTFDPLKLAENCNKPCCPCDDSKRT